jgi:hypothetical protein
MNFIAGEWNMGNKRKWGPFIISGKISNAVQVDTHIGAQVELASYFTVSESRRSAKTLKEGTSSVYSSQSSRCH